MLYIFHGPNDFARNEKIAELKAGLGDPTLADLNMTQLDGHELKLGDIRHHADAMPFMTAKRLVIIKGYLSQLKTPSEELKQLIEYLGRLPPTTDLILVEHESLPKQHPILKTAIETEGLVIDFAELDKHELRGWIMQRVQEHKATIEPGAAELLGRLIGPNLRTLTHEIEKLTLYVNQERPIQRADVELLTPYTEEAEDFGLASAIGHRNARKAYDQ
jgi:DNA polymerase-3 subunit delta